MNLGMGLDEIGDFDFASNVQVKNVEKKVDDVVTENKRLADREKILEMRVKKVESDNKLLLKKIEADQTEIDILKVRVAELEEEKTHIDEQNMYFELKNQELEAAKALKEHEFYMMNKVIENMLGKSIEQRFEEIQVDEVRAKRQAEIDAKMRDKGKSAEGSVIVSERSIVPSLVVENPVPIPVVSAIFEEDVLLEDITAEGNDEDDSEEDEDKEKIDDPDDGFSTSSHDDGNDDGDNQGGTGIKVTEALNEKNVDDYMNDDVNEVSEGADRDGEHPLIEEGEIRHTYTLDEVLKMFNVNEDEFTFNFEEELNAFDINHQPEYEYKYVEDADVYDRVERIEMS
ncbi:hypothetical protein Hanom_Chr14g01265341 [Helianthus anomalus]